VQYPRNLLPPWGAGWAPPGYAPACNTGPYFCDPLNPDAYKVIVRVPIVSPYAFQWILANDRRLMLGDSVDYVSTPQTIKQTLNGAQISLGNDHVNANQPYGKVQHVSIAVDGELADPIGSPLREPPEVGAIGSRSSLLKARITLGMGTARRRWFDFDIGAGVEFDVKAYKIKNIEVLIPDPRVEIPTLADAPQPTPPATAFTEGQLSTVLTTTTYFTTHSTGQHNPLTYTTPIILNGAFSEAFVPRVADSVEVTGASSDDGLGAGLGLFYDFLYVPDGIRLATYTAPPSYAVLDSMRLPTGFTTFPRQLIPGNANAFRVRRTPGSPNFMTNLIQVLNV
jgi:hypothetical protein